MLWESQVREQRYQAVREVLAATSVTFSPVLGLSRGDRDITADPGIGRQILTALSTEWCHG
jgi:hypothetical protein